MTEVTGLSRRTCIRATKLLEGHDVMPRRRAGELVPRSYPCRSRRTGEVRGVHVHSIGRGGCLPGGVGAANMYWAAGAEEPPAPLPGRTAPTPEGRPGPRQGFGAAAWQRSEEERRARRSGRTRGP